MSTNLLRSTWVASTGSVMQTHCIVHTSNERTLQTAVSPAHMRNAEHVHAHKLHFAFTYAHAYQFGAAQKLPCWPEDCFAVLTAGLQAQSGALSMLLPRSASLWDIFISEQCCIYNTLSKARFRGAHMKDEQPELEYGPILLRQLSGIAMGVPPADKRQHHACHKGICGPGQVFQGL